MSKQSDLVSVSQGTSGNLTVASTGDASLDIFADSDNNGTNQWPILNFRINALTGTPAARIYQRENVDSLVFDNNGAERMRIDNAGRVTMPYQPSFIAFPSSSYALSTGITEIPCDATSTNIGGHFNTSTNRFTAPVAGQYLFTVSVGLDSSSNSYTYLSAELLVNGALRFNAGWGSKGGAGYGRETYSVILTLGAADYVVPRTEFSTTNFTVLGSSTGKYTSFSGHLLG